MAVIVLVSSNSHDPALPCEVVLLDSDDDTQRTALVSGKEGYKRPIG